MRPEFWHEKWQQGQIGFHRSEVHPHLVSYHEAWLAGGTAVLVPLCGKSVDLRWLAERRPTVGVELSGMAIDQFHLEQSLPYQTADRAPYQVWQSPGLQVLEGDVFDLDAFDLDGIDRVWDRACLVALERGQRIRYVAMLRRLLPAGSRVLSSVLSYDQRRMSPPPHSVPEAEVRELYRGCDVQVLEIDDVVPPVFAERGHTWFRNTLYLITL